MIDAVRVAGLREVRKALLQAGDAAEVNDALKAANRKFAERVVQRARTEAYATGRREVIRAIETVSASNRVGGVALNAGSTARAKSWALAALFGTHKRTRTRPSGAYRGWVQFLLPQRDGGPIYRAIAAERDEHVDEWLDAIEGLITRNSTQ